MREHTPTPWQIYSDADPYHVQIKGIHPGIGGAHVAEVLFPANAAFIVKCVNSHNALVKALGEIAAYSLDPVAVDGAIDALASLKEGA